jgi:hypothetical protein
VTGTGWVVAEEEGPAAVAGSLHLWTTNGRMRIETGDDGAVTWSYYWRVAQGGRGEGLASQYLVVSVMREIQVVTGRSAASAPAGSWPSQLARPAKATCPRGQTLIAPTSGRTDALGVVHVTYKSDPGLVAVVPPRGLTAGKVTPAVRSRASTGHGPFRGA